MLRSIILILCVLIAGTPDLGYALSTTQDTDGDSIPDLQEDVNRNGSIDLGETDPYNADSDNGGESDGVEKAANRNPLDQTDDLTFDADSDGLLNGFELLRNTDPKKVDTDGDGVRDMQDPFPLDSKFQKDENGNGLPDEWEKATGLDKREQLQATVDDPDADGLKNAEELARGTDPLRMDTDQDGIDDNAEIAQGTNPRENACLIYTEDAEYFPDVTHHWSLPYITTLQRIRILPEQLPIVRGYEETTGTKKEYRFAPDQPITRYEFLKIMLLSSCTKIRTYIDRAQQEFSDVRKSSRINEHPDASFRRFVIYTAAHQKIVEGYPEGSFRPDAPVTRAEAMKMLALGARLSLSEGSGSTTTSAFSDVQPNDWFAPYVLLGASRGIVQGYGDGTFGPHRPITRAEATAMIVRAMRQNPFVNGYVVPSSESD